MTPGHESYDDDRDADQCERAGEEEESYPRVGR
jgi:hypothetical protein